MIRLAFIVAMLLSVTVLKAQKTGLDTARANRLIERFNHNLDKNSDSALVLAKALADMTDAQREPGVHAKALNMLAGAHWLRADYVATKTAILQARELFRARKDSTGLFDVENTLGILDIDLGRYEQSLQRFRQALRYHPDADSASLSNLLINQGVAFMELGIMDSASRYFHRAYRMKARLGTPFYFSLVELNLADLHFRQHHSDSGRYWALRSIEHARENQQYKTLAHAWIVLAKIRLERGDPSSAIGLAGQALATSRQFGFRETERDAHEVLSHAHSRMGNPAQALQYLETYRALNDSIRSPKHLAQIHFLEQDYQREKHLREQASAALKAQRLLNESQRLRIWLLVMLLALLAVTATGTWWYQRTKLTARNRTLQLAREEMSRKQAEVELERKHRELLTEALRTRQTLESLRELQSDFKGEKEHSAIRHALERKLKTFESGQDGWEEFRTRFEQVHPSFFKDLRERHPHLTPGECRLAALLSLNITSKQIAGLLGITASSVDVARHRLRKKLKLDPEASLYHYLEQIII